MIALVQFIVIFIGILFSKHYFNKIIEKSKEELEEKKQEKLKLQQEYELRLKQKRAADKTPYELKLEEIEKQETEIQNLQKESEQYNSTDSYVKFSKIQRQILKIKQQLEKEKQLLEELKILNDSVCNTNKEKECSQEEIQLKQKQEELTKKIEQLVSCESNTKQKERVINGAMPLFFIFIFYNFPIVLNFDISKTLWPLSIIISDIEGNNSFFSKTIWVFICFRVVSIVIEFYSKKQIVNQNDKKQN
ncbi:transmembrane protein, putative (macronuclear) [Tetrahymena thermophila SB210]|uniref:Transmembrane protein, putative n=1 Tax=Tetrahymena thermophila (strain SB210) TaxID=312017 RepID=Q23R60_TETTS|nr:transmembrane protein, putative [Tetrahymena thermophila SB210]EAR98981.1 transmembrane protein, putative [Tetrahymena thermophila SB210]|eukprot:XP_001019226.1 transmembrane protein, putative [Tetrahymena thermophila SB210]